MAPIAARPAPSLVQDLREDFRTRWIPDVIADADAIELAASPELGADSVSVFPVPKSRGGFRRAPVLTVSALAAQRDAVAALREHADEWLEPTVCGYRNGADGDSEYSAEYQRFRAICDGYLDTYPLIVSADVERFFDAVHGPQLHASMRCQFGAAWQPVQEYLERLQTLGVPGLPAGYADARLIANLVLLGIDRRLNSPFARWVDDYRIFVRSEAEAADAVATLTSALDEIGLRLNPDKVSMQSADEFVRRVHGNSLTSVYHPGDESSLKVRASLRTVFVESVNADDRRLLRFALPRLAEQGDSFALEYALVRLQERLPIDSPRLVQYVSKFKADQRFQAAVDPMIQAAAEEPWHLARLVPLAIEQRPAETTLMTLQGVLRSTDLSGLWGLLLRVFSAHGRDDVVSESISDPSKVLDARAAVAACHDLDLAVPNWISARAPGTVEALRRLAFVPIPTADTLL